MFDARRRIDSDIWRRDSSLVRYSAQNDLQFSVSCVTVCCCPTLGVTGPKKQSNEGAALFGASYAIVSSFRHLHQSTHIEKPPRQPLFLLQVE